MSEQQPDTQEELQAAEDDEEGDPSATDTGDAAHVPDDQQADTDDDSAPNEDADGDLADVDDDGQVIDITTDETD